MNSPAASPESSPRIPDRLLSVLSNGVSGAQSQCRLTSDVLGFLGETKRKNTEKLPRFATYVEYIEGLIRGLEAGTGAVLSEESATRLGSFAVRALALPDGAPWSSTLVREAGNELLSIARRNGVNETLPFLAFCERMTRRFLEGLGYKEDTGAELPPEVRRFLSQLGVATSFAVSSLIRSQLAAMPDEAARGNFVRELFGRLAEGSIFTNESAAFRAILSPPAGLPSASLKGFKRIVRPDCHRENLDAIFNFLQGGFEPGGSFALIAPAVKREAFSLVFARLAVGAYMPDEERRWQCIEEWSNLFETAVRTRPTQGTYALDFSDLLSPIDSFEVEEAVLTVNGSLENKLSVRLRLKFGDDGRGLLATFGFPSFAEVRDAHTTMVRADKENLKLFRPDSRSHALTRVYRESFEMAFPVDRPPNAGDIGDASSECVLDLGSILYRTAARALAIYHSRALASSTGGKPRRNDGPIRTQQGIPTYRIGRDEPVLSDSPMADPLPESSGAESSAQESTQAGRLTVYYRHSARPLLPEGHMPSRAAYERAASLGVELYAYLIPRASSGIATDDSKMRCYPLSGVPYDQLEERIEAWKNTDRENGPFSVRVRTYRRPTDRSAVSS